MDVNVSVNVEGEAGARLQWLETKSIMLFSKDAPLYRSLLLHNQADAKCLISKENDFVKKSSTVNLEFLLWEVLC